MQLCWKTSVQKTTAKRALMWPKIEKKNGFSLFILASRNQHGCSRNRSHYFYSEQSFISPGFLSLHGRNRSSPQNVSIRSPQSGYRCKKLSICHGTSWNLFVHLPSYGAWDIQNAWWNFHWFFTSFIQIFVHVYAHVVCYKRIWRCEASRENWRLHRKLELSQNVQYNQVKNIV